MSNTAIVNEIDEGVLDAVRVLKAAIKDEKLKCLKGHLQQLMVC